MAIIESIKHCVKVDDFAEPGAFNKWMTGAVVVAVVFCLIGIFFIMSLEGCRPDSAGVESDEENTATNLVEAAEQPEIDLFSPVRPAPLSFPPDSNMPSGKESRTSGPIDLQTFDEKNDLIRFDDSRVWFESDHDTDDTEDDHLINRAVEIPLRRLVNLMEKRGASLKVQEGYRPATEGKRIHLENSLHREGRAVDLTCDKLSLSELAKLAWQSGFDYVLYEVPARGGAHLHCSMKRLPVQKGI